MKDIWKNYSGLSENIELVDRRIKEVLKDSPIYMKEIIGHLMKSKGKYVRAALLIKSGELGNKKNMDRIINLAAAIEILHLATLVHDDIIDEAVMRRGTESLQHRYGKSKAVMCGDYLFAKCYSLLSTNHQKHMEYLAKGIERICAGEIYQQDNRYNTNLSVRQYLRTISGKTAALFAMSMYAGAIEGGLSRRKSQLLAKAGFAVGMCFQIIDDCLDYSGTVNSIGKSVQKDMLLGYYTLPLIYAIHNEDGDELEKELECLADTKDDVSKAVELVIKLGGVEKSKALADKYKVRATKFIDKLKTGNKTEDIKNLITFLLTRTF